MLKTGTEKEVSENKLYTDRYIIEEAKNFLADIVLLDIGIKGHPTTGLDIVPNLREILPQAKLFVLSNYSQAVVAEVVSPKRERSVAGHLASGTYRNAAGDGYPEHHIPASQ